MTSNRRNFLTALGATGMVGAAAASKAVAQTSTQAPAQADPMILCRLWSSWPCPALSGLRGKRFGLMGDI
ncbi:MAG: twin-arginine translocation signal domain-containing protein [Synechococcales cyanobacterium RM1_1_8]|nr:twin-arginine translocation signal domain-containing protein [Synechococcales cyanobacterium RM1_1_8]